MKSFNFVEAKLLLENKENAAKFLDFDEISHKCEESFNFNCPFLLLQIFLVRYGGCCVTQSTWSWLSADAVKSASSAASAFSYRNI